MTGSGSAAAVQFADQPGPVAVVLLDGRRWHGEPLASIKRCKLVAGRQQPGSTSEWLSPRTRAPAWRRSGRRTTMSEVTLVWQASTGVSRPSTSTLHKPHEPSPPHGNSRSRMPAVTLPSESAFRQAPRPRCQRAGSERMAWLHRVACTFMNEPRSEASPGPTSTSQPGRPSSTSPLICET